MPKSAPRRKRIRTARAEADPTSLPESKTGSSSNAAAGESSSSTKTAKSQQSAKKSAAGQDREKHLGPVLDKVRYIIL